MERIVWAMVVIFPSVIKIDVAGEMVPSGSQTVALVISTEPVGRTIFSFGVYP